jgi:hypothetical protein
MKTIVNNGDVAIIFNEGLSLEKLASKTDIFPEDLGFLSVARRSDFNVSREVFANITFSIHETESVLPQ